MTENELQETLRAEAAAFFASKGIETDAVKDRVVALYRSHQEAMKPGDKPLTVREAAARIRAHHTQVSNALSELEAEGRAVGIGYGNQRRWYVKG